MKAPDKIYLRTGMSGLFYGSKEKSFESDIEYIRKDVLLEWLNQGFDWVKTPLISVQQVIDKIKSL